MTDVNPYQESKYDEQNDHPFGVCSVLSALLSAHDHLQQRSPTFLTSGASFVQDSFSMGVPGWFKHIYCALYFYYYYISATSGRQVSDPRGGGPLT